MLHIHNGDSSANTAKSSVSGEHIAFRESLITGPTPLGVLVEDWRALRAQHLSESYGVDLRDCEQGLIDQEKKLATFTDYDEVVLWFEHDLFCQTNLLFLLNWFAQQNIGNTKVSLICIGEFPGKENFRGLGELNPEQLSSLFPGRQQVTSHQLKLAQSAWEAYCSPNPTQIERVLQNGTSELPFLDAAFRLHLRRFPSRRNGLGRIENTSLQLLASGPSTFLDLFPRFGDAEPVYGLGDAQLWLALERMSLTKQPMLTVENGKDAGAGTPDIVPEVVFEITEAGEAVLAGEADYVELNGIDQWLGGVHLSLDNLWRWDESSKGVMSDTLI